MSEVLKILKQGAEAKLYISNYLGKPTLVKERFVKKYRQPELDTAITKERIKNEARAIVRCKTADVKTPALYLVDFERRRIYMQHFVHSITVKDFIINIFTKYEQNGSGDGPNSLDKVAALIGQTVRKLHENNIIHGDLTTSNMLLIPKNTDSEDNDLRWLNIDTLELVMIDFGLSSFDTSPEDKGVDLYVLERALISTHNDYPEIFSKILDAYKTYSKNNVKEVISKFEEVRARGRKRTMRERAEKTFKILAPTVMKMMSLFQSFTQLLPTTGPRPGPTTSSLSPKNWNIVGSVVKPGKALKGSALFGNTRRNKASSP